MTCKSAPREGGRTEAVSSDAAISPHSPSFDGHLISFTTEHLVQFSVHCDFSGFYSTSVTLVAYRH